MRPASYRDLKEKCWRRPSPLEGLVVDGKKLKVVSVSAGPLLICVSAAVLLVAKGFVRLPRLRILSLGRLAW